MPKITHSGLFIQNNNNLVQKIQRVQLHHSEVQNTKHPYFTILSYVVYCPVISPEINFNVPYYFSKVFLCFKFFFKLKIIKLGHLLLENQHPIQFAKFELKLYSNIPGAPKIDFSQILHATLYF